MLDCVRYARSLATRIPLTASRSTCKPKKVAKSKSWRRPCLRSPCCPRHNPPPPSCCTCCEPPPKLHSTKCAFLKYSWECNHGCGCTCHVCCACRAAGEEYCSLQDLHGKYCDCTFCLEPHDRGCECPTCRKPCAFTVQLPEKRGKTWLHVNVRKPKVEAPEKSLKQRVLETGEDCYVLLHHAARCDCECCKKCKAELEADVKQEKETEKEMKRLLGVLEKQAQVHGEVCTCLQCNSLRLRVEIAMCNEHLRSCKLQKLLGTNCRCTTCAACIQRLRRISMPKADDSW